MGDKGDKNVANQSQHVQKQQSTQGLWSASALEVLAFGMSESGLGSNDETLASGSTAEMLEV